MEVELEVEQHDGRRTIMCAGEPDEAVTVIVERAILAADIGGEAFVEFLEQDEVIVRKEVLARHLPHHRIRAKISCVDVHFESDHERHLFPARAPWSLVHRWACRHFDVAHDACANLELREGASDGPPLNDANPIGSRESCVQVWVVNPGPEPFGGSPRQ
jgi:hypothetical protein